MISSAFLRTPLQRATAILAACAFIVATSACTPSQQKNAQTIIQDINEVVALAGAGLSVVQAFGALNTAQDQVDAVKAETYFGNASKVASEAITEWNSSDSMTTKVDDISAWLTDIAPVGPIMNAKIKASVDLLAAAVAVLLQQLGVPVAATPTTAARAIVRASASVPAATAGNFGWRGMIPGTTSHRLKDIQKQANANAALARTLLSKATIGGK